MGAVTEFLVITGLSGAGRSLAADGLEDLGWFVVDNLPIELLDKVVELSSSPGSYSRLSLVVGPTTHPEAVCDAIHRLREHHRVRVLFLDASTPELVKRYGTTRRKHPLDDGASEPDDVELAPSLRAASVHPDAHVAKYALACAHAAEDDPAWRATYHRAAAHLVAWWEQHG